MPKTSINASEAHAIALQFITFIASDEERLDRFSNLSGMTMSDLKNGINDPVFLGFVFDYGLQDEALILSFAATHDIKPETLFTIRQGLPGAQHDI